MIRIATLRIVDYTILGISGLTFLLCLGCALYAVPWNKARRKQDVTKDFNIFWTTRLTLQVASAVWLLVQWLRLEALWQPGSRIFPSRVTSWTGNGTLCRLYICISMGLLEPFCLFTAVLLLRGVLSKRRPKELGWPNAWVVGLALLLAIPFVAAQTVTAWMSVIIPGHQWERKRAAGTYMLASFVNGSPTLCDNSDGKLCLLCFFPAAANIIGCISSFIAATLLWICTQKMINTVINRRLRCRLRAFQLMMIIVLVTMNATRAATIVRGTPFAWAFEMLWLAHFLTIPVLVAIYSIFLVIIPVWDTSKAAKGIQKMQKDLASEAQTKADSSRRRTDGPTVPKTLSGRPNDTLLTLEHDKSEVTSSTRV